MLSVHWLHFKSVCYARDITGAIYPVCNYYVQILQLLKRPSDAGRADVWNMLKCLL